MKVPEMSKHKDQLLESEDRSEFKRDPHTSISHQLWIHKELRLEKYD